MRNPAKSLALAAALAFGAIPSLLAQQPAADQPPAFRSGVELVMVDVGVMDRQGQPVRGLGIGDFTVSVAGVPRRVVSAEFVDAAAARAALAAHQDSVPVSTNEGGGVGHLFVFVVDQGTLEPTSARNVAKAASRFLARLTPNDRSSLVVLPIGGNIAFTWAHDRVAKGLEQMSGLGSRTMMWDYGSLSEAREIANHNPSTLRTVWERECGSSASGGGVTGAGFGAGAASGGGTPSPGGGSGSTPGGTGGSGGAPSGSGSTGGSSGFSSGGAGFDTCSRTIQMQAESAWRDAEITSQSSLVALRQLLATLALVPGDKTLILISGGWPLNENEEMSIISNLASDAAAARATIFPLFVPRETVAADRREMSMTPARDQYIHSGPLETVAAMTGGGFFRVDVGADGAFERLGRETSGYYRLGIQREPGDAQGKSRHLKIQVVRTGVMVRARDMFDVRTYEDRDWSARLASALESPLPATGVGLRLTSYVAADPRDRSHVKLVLVGEASRLQPGEVNFRVLLRDMTGSRTATGEQRLGEATADGVMPFSTELSIPEGTYIARVAVIDSTGRVGSVDHRFEARPVALGVFSVTGPVLVRVPSSTDQPPQIALETLRQDDRLAIEVDLDGDSSRLADAGVEFSIASSKDAPPLVHASATVSPGPRTGSMVAQAVADMRLLPPGTYVARAQISAGNTVLGELRREFTVLGAATPAAAVDALAASPRTAGKSLAATVAGTAPPFGVEQVLAPRVRNQFLDRIAARPDVSSPEVRQLIESARADSLSQIVVPDSAAGKTAAGAFVSGLALLEQKKLDPAANAFRAALRASPDFYPAMVYLGACYAGGGKDKEAIAAWRTAMIRESDASALHELLADALLREGRDDLALETINGARARWPDDQALQRKYVTAALRAGDYTNGLTALDQLIEKKADDDSTLTLGLLVLYEAFTNGAPIQSVETDRVRMTRLAETYHARGGPSQALVDMWVAAALKKQ